MEAIQNADLIPIVAGLVALLLGGLWYGLRQSQKAGRDLKRELDEARRLELELREALHAAEKQVQGLELELSGERKLVKQQIEQFEKNRAQLKLEFENLANRILEDKTRSFDKTNKTALESLLKPFREQVEGFQKRVNDVHSESLKGNAALESEIKKVLEVGLKIGSDAKNLTEALKGDSQRRGSWGETQLEKTLQMSGLVEHDHYQKQTAMKDAEGRRKQTDFLIKLPGDKHIIIDSKVSLTAYDRAVAAETDEQLERALAEHVRAVKRHIDDLQGKDYTNLAGIRSPTRFAHPVNRLAPRVGLPDDRLRLVPGAQPGGPQAREFGPGQIRDIDVEHGIRRHYPYFHPLDQQSCHAGGRIVITRLRGHQRDRQRRPAQETPLHGRRDGARVQHIVTQVGPTVDTGDHKIRSVLQQAGDREMYAIGRRPIDIIETVVELPHAQGRIQGERIAGGAAVAVRRHDGQAAERFQGGRQGSQSRCIDAIIVAEEYG